MCFVSLVAIIDEITFAATSPNAMPLHLFGLDKSPVFRRIHRPNFVNASGLYSLSCQYFRIVLRNNRYPAEPKFLKASGGMPFGPGLFRTTS